MTTARIRKVLTASIPVLQEKKPKISEVADIVVKVAGQIGEPLRKGDEKQLRDEAVRWFAIAMTL